MLLINTQYIQYLLLPTFFQGGYMFIQTKFVYTFCYYQQENPGKYVVDQHTVYTVSVTNNIFSGRICLYQQSLYILFVTNNKKILENMLVVTGTV